MGILYEHRALIADLECHLDRQRKRAEEAEAALKELRDDVEYIKGRLLSGDSGCIEEAIAWAMPTPAEVSADRIDAAAYAAADLEELRKKLGAG
jgi:hypothetical protein